MEIEEKKERLLTLLYEKSFMYRDDPPFTLASGTKSPYYFNCKAITLDPEGLSLVGSLMFNEVRAPGIDAIGGLTLGADPIAIATSLEAHRNGHKLLPMIVRKEAKKHGTQKWIEGNIEKVKNVVVIDDVITTGGSTITAIERIQESGLNIVKAIALIDRQEGGKENIEAKGIEIISLFKRSDFDIKRREGDAR